jgi:pyruvate/2-oxoacid:ferredoxin oxidoreductase beta subunit
MSEETKRTRIEDMLARTTKGYWLYVNYDNEAFMNTGIQESSATPPFASTTTGPGGKAIKGKVGIKQDILEGFALLGLRSGFFATANPAYPQDFIGKVIDALTTPGASFITVLSSCQRGWRHDESETNKLEKLATECGYFPLYSVHVKDGKPSYTLNEPVNFNKDKVIEWVKALGKFRHLFKPEFMEANLEFLTDSIRQRTQNILDLVDKFNPGYKIEKYNVPLNKLANQEHIAPGHGLCPGCGEGQIITQLAMGATAVAGNNVVYVNATSCLEVSTSKDNTPSWKVPWVHHLFETAPTMGDALSTAYRTLAAKGKLAGDPPRVISVGGDGSTYDIGFQQLKGAIGRQGAYGVLSKLINA